MKPQLLKIVVLCQSLLIAQTQSTSTLPAGTTYAAGKTAPSPLLQSIENSNAVPKYARANITQRLSLWDWTAPYRNATAPPLYLGTADRAQSLVRNGAIYLSLYDAIAMAVENNLDVEVARYQLSIAGTDVLRARGGGNLRGLDYTVAESPTGVGGPGSPLLNSAAATVTPTAPTVNDLTSLNILTETPANLGVQSPPGYSEGPPVPVFDPSLVGQTTWFQRSNGTTLTTGTLGTTASALPATQSALNFVTANFALIKGFSSGTQVELDETNAAQVLYGNQGQLDPFSAPSISLTVTQPLLRGFGRDVNLRYVKIAQIGQKISRLIFDQQLISTVYGVARLYYDLVSLTENEQVKRDELAAAQKLYEDDKAQVEQGTLAPLDLMQAQSLVASSEMDLIQSEGLVSQQEVILKSQLAKRGTADPVLANLHIIPTDKIVVPPADDLQPLDQLVSGALATRPDLAQAALQVESGEVSVRASQNAVRPEIDVIGNVQTRGSTETPFATPGTPGTGLVESPANLGVAGLRLSRIYQAGVQLNLPLRNRATEADAARDLLQLRQSQARTQQLANQVREEIESSVIALEAARSTLAAATQARIYQEQLVSAELDKLSVGASTNFLVVQQESYLAQARSTEVAARSVWIKARVALDRALGDLLQKNGISFDDSVRGELPPNPRP